MTDARRLFDAWRAYKREATGHPLDGLTQADVDDLNSAIQRAQARWKGQNAPTAAQDAPVSTKGGSTVSTPHPPPGNALAPSQAAFALIKEFEGYAKARPDGSVEAYPDPASGGEPFTVGFGSTGPGIVKGTVWTREQAEQRLEADVNRFAAAVAGAIGDTPTSQGEFDAMTSLAYNVGLGNLQKSTLLRKHKAGDKAGAAEEFVRWNKAAGKVMAGLTRRREAEARLYRG